jgi:hypothetical protein
MYWKGIQKGKGSCNWEIAAFLKYFFRIHYIVRVERPLDLFHNLERLRVYYRNVIFPCYPDAVFVAQVAMKPKSDISSSFISSVILEGPRHAFLRFRLLRHRVNLIS